MARGRPKLPKSQKLGVMFCMNIGPATLRQLDTLAKLRGVSRARAARDVMEKGIAAAIRRAEAEREFES
jgi:hypothetical protein